MASSYNKRKRLDVKIKAAVQRDLEKGFSYHDVAEKWRIYRDDVSNRVKNRETILEKDQTGSKHRKSLRHNAKFQDWKSSCGGLMLLELAKREADRLNLVNFKASACLDKVKVWYSRRKNCWRGKKLTCYG